MQVTAISNKVPAKAIRLWLKSALTSYKTAKLQFSFFSVVTIIVGVIPLLGAFMLPLFTAKYADIASKIEQNVIPGFGDFFKGLFAKKSILIIGVLHALFYIVILFIKLAFTADMTPSTPIGMMMEIIFTIFAIILIMILILAFWLAPIICLKNSEITVIESLVFSVKSFFMHIGKILIWTTIVIIVVYIFRINSM